MVCFQLVLKMFRSLHGRRFRGKEFDGTGPGLAKHLSPVCTQLVFM